MTKLQTIAVVVGALALSTGCRDAQGGTAEHRTARPVKVLEVRTLEAAPRVRYSVSIQPYEQLQLAFRAGGYVADVRQRRAVDGRAGTLQPGDVVKAGSVLAQVRDADYRERLNQATSALQEADAAQAKAALDLDRARRLFEAASLTKPDLDAAQSAFDAGASRVASARAQVALAEIALRDCTLVSPMNGVVLERRIESGTLVAAGTVGFLIGNLSAVKAIFGIPDSLLQRIAPGQPLEVTTEAFPGTRFEGRVTAIAPVADVHSRVFNVELTIANTDGRLKPGMIGTVEVPTAAAEAAAVAPGTAAVPLAAVVRASDRADGYAVFVVEGAGERQIARSRPVVLGHVQGNAVAVTHGLRPGEQVIVMGASFVTSGESVRVIP